MQPFWNATKAHLWSTHVLAFCVGLLVLLVVQNIRVAMSACNKQYDMINPQLRCDKVLHQGEWGYETLRDALLEQKNTLKTTGMVSHISIYFRDLDHGPRFGIGEYEKFHPASLRKLPILVAYLHMADLDPAILDKTLSFSGALKINPNIEGSDQTIQPNTQYTIRDLLEKMIIYSDNYSYTLLTNGLNAAPPIIPYYTFRDLGVKRMMLDPNGDFIAIDAYANLFAVLYNTGYLSKEMSEYALELMAKATFNEGLAAGVPEGTRVAHKFGERFVGNDTELHDCGIVYHPEMAYVLCVMTTGTDFAKQKSAIAQVSGLVYATVSSLSLHEGSKDGTQADIH